MIVAWLCGAFFGGLVVWERWAHAERERRWQQLLDTLPPSDDEFDMEAWDKLGDEAWAKFPTSGTISVHGQSSFGVLPVAKDWKPVEGLRHISTGDLPI